MKNFTTLLLILCLSFTISCTESSSSKQPSKTDNTTASKTISLVLSPKAFAQKMVESNPILLDLRTPEELVNTGYIAQAQNFNFYDSSFQTKINALAKDKPIMVYCASGGRSGKTAKLLIKAGFEEVYDLEGGMTQWLASNMPVEKK